MAARLLALDGAAAGQERGRALEDLVVEIFESLPGVHLSERNLLSGFGEAEIDSTWTNDSPERGLIGFQRDVLMECKSSQDPLNAAGVQHFASQATRRGVRWCLIVALNGITGTPERINAAQFEVYRAANVDDTWVMVLVADELRLVRSAEHLEAVIGAKHRRQFGKMTAVTLSEREITELDPNQGKIHWNRGRDGLMRAIRREENRVIDEMLDGALQLEILDDASAIDRAADSLSAVANSYAAWRETDDDPFMYSIRAVVLDAGSAFGALLFMDGDTEDHRRVVRFEVREQAPRRVRAHVGHELWEILTNYYVRELRNSPDYARRAALTAVMALILEEIIAIDNIDPADVYDGYYEQRGEGDADPRVIE